MLFVKEEFFVNLLIYEIRWSMSFEIFKKTKEVVASRLAAKDIDGYY
jgi:hypothetical protein